MLATSRAYQDGDLYYMDRLRVADSVAMGPVTQLDEILLEYSKRGPALSYITDDLIIAIVGGVVVWPGVMEIWALTTNAVHKYPLFFHRTTIDLISKYQKELGLHRMQCTVHIDNKRAQKWIEHLGFNSEGIHEMYGPDRKDHIRYAKLWRS